MVYCMRCGTQNPDNASNCYNCGASLYNSTQGEPYHRHEHRRHHHDDYEYRGSGLGLLFGGLIIIVIALAILVGFTQIWSYLWPIILVLIGVGLIILGINRNLRHR